ncbi:MAG: DNA translocase FtsK 4TM domain-containing protein [Chitinophagaceae bacterium]
MASKKKQHTTSKKTPTSKSKKDTTTNSFFSIIKDVPIPCIVGVFFIFFAIFLSFAFFSYFYTWQNDQDKLQGSIDFISFLKNNTSTFENQGGKIGAWLAHTLFKNYFGLSNLLFIPFFLLWGIQLLFKQKWMSILRLFFFTTLLVLLFSISLAYYLSPKNFVFPFGGTFGNTIIQYLTQYVGNIGTLIMVILASLLGLGLLFKLLSHFPLFNRVISTSKEKIEHLSTTLAQQKSNIEDAPIQVEESLSQHNVVVEEAFFEEEIKSQEMELQSFELENETKEEIVATQAIELETHVEEINNEETSAQDNFTLEVVKKEDDTIVIENDHAAIGTDEPYDPSLDLRDYQFPTLDLLEQRSQTEISIDKNELEQNKNQIINTLKSFGISISKISATVGPTVTLYEIVPAEGVRISKIRNLEDDIALSLAALGIRIIAPIPGKGTIGIEVPNLKKQLVGMRTLIASEKFIHNDFSLPIALGKKIDNENYIVDLAKMPHLLMAGATGQGKSVGINTILVSLLYKKHPSQVKFVMVDPKKVELSIYKLIEKHFLAKLPNEEEAIITDTKKVINTLNALCIEMDNRYDLLKEAGVRNIKEYNEKFIKRRLNPNKGHQYLPFIVLVVDEFADLIMTAGKEVEMPIARLAQLARAIGIHLIIATQRPSVNVITGTIKANFPARVAFRVSAKVDSRTILDAGGAEQLIGQGDMLILNGSDLVRLQCAFVDTPEVERIVEFIGNQRGYPSAFDLPEYESGDSGGDLGSNQKSLKDVDAMFEQCARLVVSSNSGSTSMLQRRFNLGYNRAGRIMDQMEAAGIVGPTQGSKPREIMVHTEAELDVILRGLNLI